MKKIVLTTVIITAFLAIALLITAFIVSFTVVMPTTQAINKKLATNLQNIVRIPQNIPPPIQDFDETNYYWEMETLEKEVIGVRFKHATGFSKSQDKITAVLEMPEKGDPSIFNKVLPAVISDDQSLKSALDPKKANLSANQKTGYTAIGISVIEESNQTARITWEFKKSDLDEEVQKLYAKLEKYPQFLLKVLYSLPKTTLSLLST